MNDKFTSNPPFFLDYTEQVGAIDWDAHKTIVERVDGCGDKLVEGLNLLPLGQYLDHLHLDSRMGFRMSGLRSAKSLMRLRTSLSGCDHLAWSWLIMSSFSLLGNCSNSLPCMTSARSFSTNCRMSICFSFKWLRK